MEKVISYELESLISISMELVACGSMTHYELWLDYFFKIEVR